MDNIKVKVGGTYVDIEDFISQYSGIEASKFKKKSGLKDRLKRKFARQRAQQKQQVNLGIGVSPARSNSSLVR